MTRAVRFPGFNVRSQSDHWDDATRAVIVGRVNALPAVRFFTPAEEAAAKCLLDQLVDQRTEPGSPRVDLVRMVDARLAEKQTDGWRYDTMPPDGAAWQQTLAALDEDSQRDHGVGFARCTWEEQHAMLEAFRDADDPNWHGLPRSQVWNLWTRYAATAFYSHPELWNEIGFSGPAYPRGYKNLGIDRLESYEVHDAEPGDDPMAGGTE
ncbi:MAG: gluconate 2-dehydrogenase subunit 3 family protein [Acidobacteria bacterium]|nr:gluconate 2-dehydrogenase subunit 3 family protein [Acidobacteriota bacterium]